MKPNAIRSSSGLAGGAIESKKQTKQNSEITGEGHRGMVVRADELHASPSLLVLFNCAREFNSRKTLQSYVAQTVRPRGGSWKNNHHPHP